MLAPLNVDAGAARTLRLHLPENILCADGFHNISVEKWFFVASFNESSCQLEIKIEKKGASKI